tara:strand:+ start:785 stop:2014 length:1230 start_codon:yes stop_codon:yes gene_type:complete
LINHLEKKIIFRFLRSRKDDSFLNIISIFSFIGITLGVSVLIIVMSVMNGFRTELINKIVGFNPHLVISSYDENKISENLKDAKIKKLTNKFFYTNNGEAIVINNNFNKGLLLRGYSENDFGKLAFVNNDKFEGDKIISLNTISIGRELSFLLDLEIGDKISILSPSGIQTLMGNLPKHESFTIGSIYESGLLEFDQNIIFLNIKDLENFFNLNKESRKIEFYLKNPELANKSKNIFLNVFSSSYIYTWADLNKSLFSALKIERNVMFIILSLIIIVAAFNIISGLTILVKNKTRDIAILKSFGVQNKSIKKIFFMVGFIIGSAATFSGILLGILFSINIEKIRIFISDIFNISIFPEEIYFLSKMPSEININSIFLIGVCSIIITSLVSLYPAIKAANMDTIKSLKYE